MRWKILILINIGLLVLLSLFAIADSTITVTPIKNEITTAEQASFELSITNNDIRTQSYTIYSLSSGQGWNVDPNPLSDKIIKNLVTGATYKTKIIAFPLEEFSPGIYNVQVSVESDLGERHTETLKMYLRPKDPSGYLPAIKTTLDMNERIDPTQSVSIKLFLENRNPLNLTNLKIKMQSEIPEFVKEMIIDLPPLQKKTVEFSVTPNKHQQPKDYLIFFTFEREGEAVKIIEKKIEVISLLPEFNLTSVEEKQFLKTIRTLTITNDGNIRNNQFVKYPVSFLESLFSTNQGALKSKDGNRYLIWELSLGPNESTHLEVVTNYRLLFYVLIIILLLAGFYLYVQSPVNLKKTATTTLNGENGALSEIKITLELSNRSKKVLKEVNVIDLVPGIANIEKGLELGTLKPRDIKHTNLGTKVKWTLAELDAHEHRLITYKIKAKLNILGTFSLPRAIVEFKKKRGRRKKAYSNIFRISS